MYKAPMTTPACAYLHGKPVSIGDRVYDEIDGWGCVESISCGCLWVKVGKRTRRKYTSKGYTARRSKPTLFFHPVPRICLSKNPETARHQRELLEQTIALLNKMCPDDPVLMHPCEYGAPSNCQDGCGSCGGCGSCSACMNTDPDPDDCPDDELDPMQHTLAGKPGAQPAVS